jgi:hypothetical protein
MNKLRPIKIKEKLLIEFLLKKCELNPSDYVISELVDDYENAKMGSIGLGQPNVEYAGDIIQAEYTDTDLVQVVITLTKDTDNQLLDLDFWKVDFSKLIKYPSPEELVFKIPYTPFGQE